MQRYFQVSVHMLTMTAFLALALTGRLDAPTILVFTAGSGWSFYRSLKHRKAVLTSHAAFVLSCVYLVIFLVDALVVSGSFVPATIRLVLFLDLVKLHQEKVDRDYVYLIVLSLMKILAASSLTINMSFVATLVLYLIALVSTLMSFDMYRWQRKASTPTPNVALALGGMSVWATGSILLVGVVLFFTIPRFGSGFFSRATTPSLLLSGFSESVDLGQIGRVKLSHAIVMRAKRLGGSSSTIVRWRGIALNSFNGRGWYKSNRVHSRIPGSRGAYTLHPPDGSGDPVRFQILLEPLATTALFGPHRIRSIRGPIASLERDSDEAVYTRTPASRRLQYEVLSEVPRDQRTNVVAAGQEPVPAEIRSQYLQLPSDLDPRIQMLALQVTSTAQTFREKAAAVESYLKANYKYTLELTWNPGPQPISTFLLSAKSGHCEYFASSMAILLRTAGVPTRIVNGFLMGEYNPVGDDYIVRQSDAHSWVEVYVPDRGWIEFDPTPPDPRQRAAGFMAGLSRYVDAAELYWNSYILIYDSGAQFQLFRSAQDTAQLFQANMMNSSDRWIGGSRILAGRIGGQMQRIFGRPWLWLLLGSGALAGMGVWHQKPLRTRLAIRRLRKGAGSVNDDVIEEMFYRAARLAEGKGPGRRPAETWREWILALPEPDRRSRLATALEIFEKSKYGRMPVSTADFLLLEETIRVLKA